MKEQYVKSLIASQLRPKPDETEAPPTLKEFTGGNIYCCPNLRRPHGVFNKTRFRVDAIKRRKLKASFTITTGAEDRIKPEEGPKTRPR